MIDEDLDPSFFPLVQKIPKSVFASLPFSLSPSFLGFPIILFVKLYCTLSLLIIKKFVSFSKKKQSYLPHMTGN